MKINYIEGDLIKLALQGKFDVIGHGCNCYSTMGAGIAVGMARTFKCDKFDMELIGASIEKLGNIDYKVFVLGEHAHWCLDDAKNNRNEPELTVCNLYTQFGLGGKFGNTPYGIPFDYEAMTMCMRKMNKVFKGQHIGLPMIGAGLAMGDWSKIEQIIENELVDCTCTVVIYKPNA
jgi:O-acetyl-ADP-ribose deacetylase (regulator of RNase III)